MDSVYGFDDYRDYISMRLKRMPNEGYGVLRRLAEYLQVHTSLVSQILKNKKQFTLDQGALCADFFGLNEIETDYFITLIQWERAGNAASRKWIERQKQRLREHAGQLINRVTVNKKLSEQEKSIFYSNWSYSAVRQMTAIKGFDQIEPIAEYLKISPKRVRECVEFLLATGLVVETKGKLGVGPNSTHLEASSPWARVNHVNWRDRGQISLDRSELSDLYYTVPMTLAKKDIDKVREKLIQAIQSINDIIDHSESEELRCLTIDWFKV